MTELFFPTGAAGRPVNRQTSRGCGSASLPLAGVAEERLLCELRDMKRQIQASCAEEIKSQSHRMLQEIKREVQMAVEHVRPGPMFGLSSSRTEDAIPPPSPFMKSQTGLSSLRGGFTYRSADPLGPKGAVKGTSFQIPPLEATMTSAMMHSDPRCPLDAHGDAPPLLPVEVEPPPPPPIVEEGDHHFHYRPSCGTHRKPPPEGDEPSSSVRKLGGSRVTFTTRSANSVTDLAGDDDSSDGRHDRRSEYFRDSARIRGRLSLRVDACRRSDRIANLKPVRQMTTQDFVKSPKFDNLVGALIILNAITIGIQTDYAAKNVTDTFPDEFHVIERIFLFCFSMELVLRVYVQGFTFFTDWRNIVWNYFDMTIVLAQLFEEVLLLATDSTSVHTDTFTPLRILRILRIVRILRVVRVLHLISELRTIVSSIVGSLKSLGWTVVLLLLVIYIVGVYFTQATTDHLVEVKLRSSIAQNQQDDHLHYFFGSLSRTILSLWQSMSGGADWDSMASPLISQVGTFTGVMFASFIAFALLALMNVVTGVFVQTALQSAKDEEDAFLVDQVLKLFNKEADNDTTTITLEQVEEKFGDPSVAQEWKAINVQLEEARYLFGLLDTEETGEVSFQEFLSGCLRLHGPSKSMDLLTVMQEARATNKQWEMMSKRWEAFHYNFQATLEGIACAVTASSNLAARLSVSVDSAVDVANQNQDKIGRLEKRIRSFESSLSSVRTAASNVSKVNELIDSVIIPSVSHSDGNSSNHQMLSENAGMSGVNASTRLGILCTIDEV